MDEDRAAVQRIAEYVKTPFGLGFGESLAVALMNVGQEADRKLIGVNQEYADQKS